MFTYIDSLEIKYNYPINLLKKGHIETYEHSKRCAKHMTELAIYFQFSKEKTERLVQSAFLHDIGKIFLPIDILDKKGPLSSKEFELINKHALLGGGFLEQATSISQEVVHLIKKHHCIYSDQMEEVLILSMIDIYDALKYPRAYKPPFPHDTTFSILFDKFNDITQIYPYLNYLKQKDLGVL